jgi:hypothetical protein
MLVPISTLRPSILKFHTEMEIYPLWLCPMRLLSPPAKRWQDSQGPVDVPPISIPQPISYAPQFKPYNKTGLTSIFQEDFEYQMNCPIEGGLCAPTPSEQLYVDIGAYGIPKASQWRDVVRQVYGTTKVPDHCDQEEMEILAAAENKSDDGSIGGMGKVEEDDQNEEMHVRVLRRVQLQILLLPIDSY